MHMRVKSAKTFQKSITLNRTPLKLPYHIYLHDIYWEVKFLRERKFQGNNKAFLRLRFV